MLLIVASLFLRSDTLNRRYNSIDLTSSSSFGELKARKTIFDFIFKHQTTNFVFSYNYTLSDIEIDSSNLNNVQLDEEGDSFKLGYEIDINKYQKLIPFISIGSLDYSYRTNSIISTDVAIFGFASRRIITDNTIINLSIYHKKIDKLNDFGIDNYGNDERDSLVDVFYLNNSLLNDDCITFEAELEYHYNKIYCQLWSKTYNPFETYACQRDYP